MWFREPSVTCLLLTSTEAIGPKVSFRGLPARLVDAVRDCRRRSGQPQARMVRAVVLKPARPTEPGPCEVDAKASQCSPSPPGGTFGPRTVPSARVRGWDHNPVGHEDPPGAEDASKENIDEPIEGPGVGSS